MKKKALQIAMVCFAVLSMILINLFAWNISSMVLMIMAAVIGMVVFVIGNHQGREHVKE
jgi:chromate transporter